MSKDLLQQIQLMIQHQTGHNLTDYRQNTFARVVKRRMAHYNIDSGHDYVHFLEENPLEVDFLFKDLLVNSTEFFRDVRAFETLKKKALPSLLADREGKLSLRVWVPACSTGEEAYSIAMIFYEYLNELKEVDVQIFATDVDSTAIDVARSGKYPSSVVNEVSPERLRRFFVRKKDGFEVKDEIRKMVNYQIHDITKERPLSQIDLLSCRNLMVYLNPELTERLADVFNTSLLSGGILFLGPPDPFDSLRNPYSVVDGTWKIFKRK